MTNDKQDYNKIEEVVEVEITEPTKQKLKPVTKATRTKRNLLDRLVTGLIGPNGIPEIARKAKEEVLIPSLKDTAGDVVRSIGDALATRYFGEGRGNNSSYRGGYSGGGSSYYGKTPYNNSYWSNNRTKYHSNTQQKEDYRAAYNPNNTVELERGMNVDNFVIGSRREAQNVLDGLRDHIQEYGVVTVADYYDLIGVEPKYTDNNFGWDDLRDSRIQPTRGGFVLLLPVVELV